jgi:uncharacterized protein involved in exopolysaccharide biosynthesis/Mrp family chromosome partitioning ATPase
MSPTSRAEPLEQAFGTKLLARLWRRRLVFGTVFATVLGSTVVALVVLPVRYLASGSVIVAEQEPGLPNASAAWAAKLGDPADLESQLLVIRSTRIMRLALDAPGIAEVAAQECSSPKCGPLESQRDALLDFVQTRYSIGSVGRSRVISISYQSSSPDIAQKMANALIRAFLDDQKQSISSSRETAATWLWKEITRLDSELREEDARIQDFRRTKGLMRGATAPIASERLTSIAQQVSAAEAARAQAEARLQEVRADQATGSANSQLVLASRSVGDLKQQINTISAQVANASNAYGANHPALRSLMREQDALQKRLSAEVASIAAGAKKTFDAAVVLVNSLKRQLDEAKSEVGIAVADEASIESMVRSTELKRQQYSELFKRASELETERRVLIGSTRLVSMAEAPTLPFFPKRLPFLASGMTLALLLGAAAALLWDQSRADAGKPSDLSGRTDVKVLAELPRVGEAPAASMLGFLGRAKQGPALRPALKLARQDQAFQDALFEVYSALFPTPESSAYRTVMVTSPDSGDGKTFTTLALGRLAATLGHRVLVIECDGRSPTYETLLDLGEGPGLGGVLNGDVSPREAISRTATTNLDALPAGQFSPSPVMMKSKQMTDLLDWAEVYDLVLIDSAPAASLETRVLAKQVDGVLCCARAGRSATDSAMAALEAIRGAGGQIAGMAITMAKPRAAKRPLPTYAPNQRYNEAT